MKRNSSLVIIFVLFFLFLLSPIAVAGDFETKTPVLTPESNRLENVEVFPTEKNQVKRLLLQKKAKEQASKKRNSTTSTTKNCACEINGICVSCTPPSPKNQTLKAN